MQGPSFNVCVRPGHSSDVQKEKLIKLGRHFVCVSVLELKQNAERGNINLWKRKNGKCFNFTTLQPLTTSRTQEKRHVGAIVHFNLQPPDQSTPQSAYQVPLHESQRPTSLRLKQRQKRVMWHLIMFPKLLFCPHELQTLFVVRNCDSTTIQQVLLLDFSDQRLSLKKSSLLVQLAGNKSRTNGDHSTDGADSCSNRQVQICDQHRSVVTFLETFPHGSTLRRGKNQTQKTVHVMARLFVHHVCVCKPEAERSLCSSRESTNEDLSINASKLHSLSANSFLYLTGQTQPSEQNKIKLRVQRLMSGLEVLFGRWTTVFSICLVGKRPGRRLFSSGVCAETNAMVSTCTSKKDGRRSEGKPRE